ncbi:MAG: hypothetical protein AB7P49_20015, partial [Bdellovibrionales bacterium]
VDDKLYAMGILRQKLYSKIIHRTFIDNNGLNVNNITLNSNWSDFRGQIEFEDRNHAFEFRLFPSSIKAHESATAST